MNSLDNSKNREWSFWNFKLNDQIGVKILKIYHCAMGLLHPTARQRSGMRNEMMSTFDRTFLANKWNRVSNIWLYFFNKQLKQGVQLLIILFCKHLIQGVSMVGDFLDTFCPKLDLWKIQISNSWLSSASTT